VSRVPSQEYPPTAEQTLLNWEPPFIIPSVVTLDSNVNVASATLKEPIIVNKAPRVVDTLRLAVRVALRILHIIRIVQDQGHERIVVRIPGAIDPQLVSR